MGRCLAVRQRPIGLSFEDHLLLVDSKHPDDCPMRRCIALVALDCLCMLLNHLREWGLAYLHTL